MDLSTLRMVVDGEAGIRTLDRYDNAATRANKSSQLLDSALGRLTAAFGVAVVVKKFTDETIAAQNAQAQLEAAVRSTGGAAGRTVTQLQALASQLQDVGVASDDAVQGAQAMLLTFTQIKGSVFDDATRAVVDLAARMGGDLSGAALQVGKALQDPANGLLALTRSGISFSESQKETIKTLAETGRLAEAQQLILAELTKEFGGSAAAARDTLGGALTALNNAFGDLFEVSRGSSGAAIASINLLTRNLDTLVTAGLAVSAVFGARFLADTASRTAELGLSIAKNRAESAAYAEAELRNAAANKAASAQRVAALAAERVELRALAALERERLVVANARIARAVPVEALAPLGGAVAQRDNAAVAFSIKAQADAQAALNAVQERTLVVNGALAAENATLTATTNAATAAQTRYAAATSLSARASSLASGALGLVGGPVGAAVLVAMGAITLAFNQQAKAQENAKKRTDDYLGALGQLSPAALQAALATEQLGLAQIQQTKVMTGVEFDAKQKMIAASKERIAALEGIVSAQTKVAKTAQNSAIAQFGKDAEAVNEQLAILQKNGKLAADAFKLANDQWVDASGKNRTLAEALRQNDGAALSLSKAALAATAAQDKLSKATTALGTAMKDVAKAAKKEQAEAFRAMAVAAEGTARVLQINLDAMNQTMVAQSAATIAIADSTDKRKGENQQIREQIAALLSSAKAYETVLLIQQQSAAVAEEQAKLPAGTILNKAQVDSIKEQVAANTRLLKVRQAILDLDGKSPFKIPVKETDQWADSLETVASQFGAIASIFGGVGTQLTKAIQLSAQLAVSVSNASKAAAAAAAAKGTPNEAAANGAARGANLAAGANFATLAFTGIKYWHDSVRATSEAAMQAAIALRELGNAAKASVAQYRLQASGTPLENQLAQLEVSFRAIIKSLLEAGAPRTEALGKRVAKSTVPTAQDVDDAIAAYEKLVAAAKRAAAFQEAQADSELNARIAAAQGRGREADAIRQQAANEKELEDARVAGATATRLLRIAEAQAAEERKREAERAEEELRSIFDFTNGARAFSDPRGASQAAFEEEQRRRYSDAVTRGASAAELLSIGLFNLAETMDRALQIAEADLRTTESLKARGLSALGNTRGAQDSTLAASQRQEIADAIRDGMSPSNFALLQFVQYAEREQVKLQRAIEEGTAAIKAAAAAQIAAIDEQIGIERQLSAASQAAFDAQIEAVRTETDAQLASIDAQRDVLEGILDVARDQLQAAESELAISERAFEALNAFGRSLLLGGSSTLSPTQKLAEARAQFDALERQARSGNTGAASNLPAAAQALLDASRNVNASGAGYVTDATRVQQTVAELTARFGAQLNSQQQTVASLQSLVAFTESQLATLETLRETITTASDAQIGVLQAAKDADKAASDAIIEKLERSKDAIEAGVQRQIDALVKLETEAFQTRVQASAYYAEWQRLTTEQAEAAAEYYRKADAFFAGGGVVERVNIDPVPVVSAPNDESTQQLKTVVTELKNVVAGQAEQIATLKQQLKLMADAAIANGLKLDAISTKLDEGNRITRLGAEGRMVS